MNPYLDLPIETGLIDIIPHETYGMSLKGKEILEKMRELRRLLEYMAGN